MRPGQVPCHECRKLHGEFGEDPPCSQCDKPQSDLRPRPRRAYNAWLLAHNNQRGYWPLDGTPLALRLEDINTACAFLGYYGREVEALALELDNVVLPMLRKEHREKKEAG